MSDGNPLPDGEFGLFEMYCNEQNCDCRRVMFMVTTPNKEVVAYIAYGWEGKDFYARWLKRGRSNKRDVCYANLNDNEKADVNEIQGPVLNSMTPQSKRAGEILDIVANTVLKDEAYIERLKRHYALFKREVKKLRPRW